VHLARSFSYFVVGSMIVAVLGMFGISSSLAQAPPGRPEQPQQSPSPGRAPGGPAPASPGMMGTGEAMVVGVEINVTQEVPRPKSGTPAAAKGAGAVVLNAAQNRLGFVFTYSGLSGPVVGAHFHRGQGGQAGPIVQTICGSPGPALAGACPTGNSNVVAGVWTVARAVVDDWQAERLYVNFHTALNPDGEIRGQVSARGMMGPGMMPGPTITGPSPAGPRP
jgi:hypothetical protein